MEMSKMVKVVIICGLTGRQLSEKVMARSEVKAYLEKHLGDYEEYAVFNA